MKSMCCIKNLCSFFSCLFCSYPRQHGTNRSMTMNNVIFSFINYIFQAFICFYVTCFQRIPLKRNIIVGITIWNHTIRMIFIIIFRSDCRFPSHFLKHFQIWNMKFHNVCLYNCRDKQNFLHMCLSPGSKQQIITRYSKFYFSFFSPIAVTCPTSTPSVLSGINKIFTVARQILKSSHRLGLPI